MFIHRELLARQIDDSASIHRPILQPIDFTIHPLLDLPIGLLASLLIRLLATLFLV